MRTQKTIYTVQGYKGDDLMVLEAFSTEEQAEEYLNAIVGFVRLKDLSVEPLRLDSNTTALIRNGYISWSVTVLRDGTVEKVTNNGVDENCTEIVYLHERSKLKLTPSNIEDCLLTRVVAKSEELAIEQARMRLEQFIAEGKWEA